MIAWKDIKKYSPTDRSKLRWWLILFGLVFTLSGNTTIEPIPFLVGVGMMVPGMILHLISKGHLHQNDILTKTGPYRWVRNPFYLANALIDFGICLIINRWELTAVFAFFWIIAYYRQIKMEENILEEEFGEDFRQYKKQVPALIPFKPPLQTEGAETQFSWHNENLMEGKECSRLFRYASYPFLMFAAEKIGHYGMNVFTPSVRAMFFSGAVGFVILYWLSLVSKKIIKKKSTVLPKWFSGEIARVGFGVVLIVLLLTSTSLQVHIGNISFAMGLMLSIPFLALLQILFFGLRSEKVWFSYRFRRILECCFCIILCIVGQLPWLCAVPILYYAPMIIYGNNGDAEPILDRVFVKNESTSLKSFLGFEFLIFSVGFAALLIKQLDPLLFF